MKPVFTLFLTICLLLFACKKEKPAPPTIPLLKEVVVRNLPSPYYHFAYNSEAQIATVSFSSDMARYVATFDANRLQALRNTAGANKDQLLYTYDANGRPVTVRVLNEGGTVLRRAFLEYDTQGRLQLVEWEVKGAVTGFAAEQTLRFSYDAQGNLAELRDQRHALENGQQAALYIDRFGDYDNGVNTDDFMLLHPHNRHPLLLPGIRLQNGNPRTNTRTGDGINYAITYTYTYNAANCPVTKSGDMVLTNGPTPGARTALQTSYSYYE